MAAKQQSSVGGVWQTVKPFVNGGMAGISATCVIQPVDIVKVRLQIAGGGSPLGVLAEIVKKEGFGTLYTGLSAGILRQITYTSSRMGIFNSLSEKLKETNQGKPIPLWQKAGAGLTAGGLGAIIGSPADLSLIRMQADGLLPPDKRRNYSGVGAALATIIREEGLMGLFTGAGPTAVRAMALNMGMLASNDQAKEMLTAQGIVGLPNVFGASAIAGFFASFFSLPFDYVKTQLQKMQPLPDGSMPYKGALDCAAKTFATGGPLKFYTGFPTFYVRIAPHAMITLVAQDALASWQKKNGY